MSEPRAFVTDTEDVDQLAFAGRIAKRLRDRRADLLRTQLESMRGREFVWDEIDRHRVDDLQGGPIEDVYAFLGRREAGIELRTEVMRDHPDAFLLMQKEAIERAKRLAQEVDAAHAPSGDDDLT